MTWPDREAAARAKLERAGQLRLPLYPLPHLAGDPAALSEKDHR